MGAYIVRRLLAAVPLLLGMSVLLFVIIQLPPGGPLDVYAGEGRLRAEYAAEMQRQLGLDQPLPVQYVRWLAAMLRGDWGRSYRDGRNVTQVILDRLPASLQLTLCSFALAVVLAVPIGVFASTRSHPLVRNAVEIATILGISIPTFWLGLIGILVLSVTLQQLPAGGMYTIGAPFSFVDRFRYLLMPAVVGSVSFMAAWSRYVRGSMLEVMRQDYVRTAQAKGLAERTVLYRHILRNALIPFITVVGARLPHLFSGMVVVEVVFSWPGIGQLLMMSVLHRDYPVLMGSFMIVGALVVVVNLATDVMYTLADPRIRY